MTVSYDQGDGLYRVDGVRGSAQVLADLRRRPVDAASEPVAAPEQPKQIGGAHG